MSEIDEVAQILRISLDGVQVAMQITGAFWKNGKDFIKLLWNVLHREKMQGKTSMRDLLIRGGDLQIFQFPETHAKQIEKALKGYGILFSVLPDLNRTDGMMEVVFHSEAVPRVNNLIQKLNAGRFIDMEQYLGNAKKEDREKEEAYFAEHFQEDTKHFSEEEKEELARRMHVLEAKESPTTETVTIAKKLIVKDGENIYLTRIPYEANKFLEIPRENAMWINGGKTMLTTLEKDQTYTVYDRNGKEVEKVKGTELYQKHYDEVSLATKRRAMEEARRRKAEARRRQKNRKRAKKGRSL